MQELTTAWTDNGTQDPASTSPNPGGIGGCTNPTPAASTIGGLAGSYDAEGGY